MRKYNKNNKINKLIMLPAFGIAALSSAVILGAAPSSYAATTATPKVDVTIGSVLAITAADIAINIASPSQAGVFATGTGTVNVATNNVSGYSVYLTSNTTATTLDHESVSASKIASIASAQSVSGTGAKFSTANTWGWSKDGTNFNPISAKGTAQGTSTLYRQTSAPSPSGDASTLTIGVTANTSLTSGKYTGTLLLTAVGN